MTFSIPSGEFETPLLRTDGAQPGWASLLEAIRMPSADGFLAYVNVVTHAELEGIDEAGIRALPRENGAETFVLVADRRAQSEPDFPILVVDLSAANRHSFRVAARCLWAVQNNLSLANMDWEEFADNVDAGGVFRDC